VDAVTTILSSRCPSAAGRVLDALAAFGGEASPVEIRQQLASAGTPVSHFRACVAPNGRLR
jgi:hypothetical protein